MHEMTLGAVFALFDAAGRYLVMTNPWGAGDGSTASTSPRPAANELKSAQSIAARVATAGGRVGHKTIDELPLHVREVLGRR